MTSGLKYTHKISDRSALGVGLEYSRQLLRFNGGGDYLDYVSLSLIWNYSFQKKFKK
jgi:hypothetical protein